MNIYANSLSGSYAEESVDAQIEGVDRSVAFNYKQLLEGLKIFGDKNCFLQFQQTIDEHKHFANVDIRAEKGDENFIYIVTPVRN